MSRTYRHLPVLKEIGLDVFFFNDPRCPVARVLYRTKCISQQAFVLFSPQLERVKDIIGVMIPAAVGPLGY